MDLGASRRGVDMGPSALRVADLARRLEALGHDVEADDDVSAALPEVLLHQSSPHPGPVGAFLPSITATCMELARVTADHGGGWRVPEAARTRVDAAYVLFAVGLLADGHPAAAAALAAPLAFPSR